ncbi:MAG TPA: FAD-dependent oxidoreductase [Anaeromyxobacteraceae bacterium]|nr:FAD-dependent oxidoreductase [Anaeromyxobacteraceae bacterium]
MMEFGLLVAAVAAAVAASVAGLYLVRGISAAVRKSRPRATLRAAPTARPAGQVSTPSAPPATGAPGATPRVIVVGAGFAGLACARALAKAPVRVTVVDRRNHHLFQPLLYQVATAGLNPADIATPIRQILRRQENADVLLADVRRVDLAGRRLELDGGDALAYDHLVLATGATHAYFGHPEWEAVAPGLKTVEDALEIRRRILVAFERAERETDAARQRAWLTFVVVGGGPTGVELAGAVAEIARHTLSSEFRHIDPHRARVILLHAGERILPPFAPASSRSAQRQLERLGVNVHTGMRVTAIDAEGVSIGKERLEARTVLWAAGVAASPLARALGAPLDTAGRVLVTPALTLPGHPEVHVVGDVAAVRLPGGGSVPGVAPAAIQQGAHAAGNVVRALAREPHRPFRYRDKGMMATVGRAAAVTEAKGWRFSGLVAWLAWLLIHVLFLVGFRNRVAVLLQWAWHYATFEREARLITATAAFPTEGAPDTAPPLKPTGT